MYSIYAVKRRPDGEKERFFLNMLLRLDAAKHLANCATLGNADYAYVKDTQGGTVFYIEKIDPAILYSEDITSQQQTRPPSPA